MSNWFNLKLLISDDKCCLIHQFSATEMQDFLLYFGLPLLKGILVDDHFHHLALLTTALWIFEAMIAHTLTGFKGTRGVAEQVGNSNNHSSKTMTVS